MKMEDLSSFDPDVEIPEGEEYVPASWVNLLMCDYCGSNTEETVTDNGEQFCRDCAKVLDIPFDDYGEGY